MFDQALDRSVYRTREDISYLLRNGRRGSAVIVTDRYKGGEKGGRGGSVKYERYVTAERFLFINYGEFHGN